MTNDLLIQEYIDSLNPLDRQAYELAKAHLTSSFQIETTHGFLKWLEKRNTNVIRVP